jgi:WD40 repeat protein
MSAWLKKLSGPAEPRVVSVRHPASIRALAAAPDGESVYPGDDEGGVYQWRPGDRGARSLDCPARTPVLGLAASRSHLVVLFTDHALRLASLSTDGTAWGEPVQLSGAPVLWEFAPDNADRFVVVTQEGRVIFWDLSSAGAKPFAAEFLEQGSAACSAALGPDSVVWLGCEDGSVRKLDLRAARASEQRVIPSAVLAVQPLPGGDWVTGHENGQLCVWTAGGTTVLGADGDPAVVALAYLDGLVVVAGDGKSAGTASGFGGQVRVLQLGDTPSLKAPVRLHGDSIVLLRPVPGGRLLSAGADGSVKLWDVEEDPLGRWPRDLAAHDQPVRALVRLPAGHVLSAAGRNLSCWIPLGGKDPGPREWCRRPCRVTPQGDLVDSADYLPAGAGAAACLALYRESVLVGDRSGLAREVPRRRTRGPAPAHLAAEGAALRDEEDRGEIAVAELEQTHIQMLPTVSDQTPLPGGTLTPWLPPHGQKRAGGGRLLFDDEEDPVEALEAAGPKGRLITGHRSGVVRIRDAASKEELLSFRGPGGCRSLAFLPSPVRVAVGHADGLVRLWREAAPGPVEVARLRGPVNAVVFLADGLLVAAGEDGCIKVFDTSGAEVASWTAAEPVVDLAVERRGSVFVVALRGRRVLRFQLAWRKVEPLTASPPA